jgi:DNA replication protein DnaC
MAEDLAIDSSPAIKDTLDVGDMQIAMFPERYWTAKLSDIPDMVYRKSIVSYIDNIDKHVRNGEGLLLWGPNGQGKTYDAIVVGKYARLHSFSVKFVLAYELAFMSRQPDWYEKYDIMIDCDLLIIDDLGKEHNNLVVRDIVLKRYSKKKSVIITTNVVDIEKDYEQTFLSVLKGMVMRLKIEGRDFREQEKIELQKSIVEPVQP